MARGVHARPHSYAGYLPRGRLPASINSLHGHRHGRRGRVSGVIASDRGQRVSSGGERALGTLRV